MSYAHVKKAREKKREKLRALKHDHLCSRCSLPFPHYCLDWHHLDPTTKEFGVADSPRDNISWERILAEIEKCVLLCKNCHAITEHGSSG